MTHFYDTEGNPKHTVIGTNGKERPSTIKDAKKHGWVPGVTDIIGQIDKPVLGRWKLDQLFKAYVETPNQKLDESYDEYKKRLFSKYNNNTEHYAKIGNLVHSKLETYFLESVLEPEYEDMLWPVIEIVNNLKFDKLEAEKRFYCDLGYGGTVDLIGYKGNQVYIIDFKTKQAKEPSKKDLYNDYAMQLAAYRNALNLESKCFNILISVSNPGTIYYHEWDNKEIEKGWKMFECLLLYWKYKNE